MLVTNETRFSLTPCDRCLRVWTQPRERFTASTFQKIVVWSWFDTVMFFSSRLPGRICLYLQLVILILKGVLVVVVGFFGHWQILVRWSLGFKIKYYAVWETPFLLENKMIVKIKRHLVFQQKFCLWSLINLSSPLCHCSPYFLNQERWEFCSLWAYVIVIKCFVPLFRWSMSVCHRNS